jgi:hypothetical protein
LANRPAALKLPPNLPQLGSCRKAHPNCRWRGGGHALNYDTEFVLDGGDACGQLPQLLPLSRAAFYTRLGMIDAEEVIQCPLPFR